MPIAVAALVCLGGCAESTHPVTGVVTFQGEPVPRGRVVFASEERGNAAASIGSSGRYQLSLPAGEYGVGITAREELPAGHKEGDPAPPLKEYVPFKFASPRSSGLSATVEAGGQNEIDFHLE